MSSVMLEKVCALSTKSISLLATLDSVFKNTDMNKRPQLLIQNQENSSKKNWITWLIEKSALDKKESFGQYIESPSIKISSPDIRKLLLYPSGKKKFDYSYVSLDVIFKKLPKNMHIECNVAVVGKKGKIILSKTFYGSTNDLEDEISFDDFFFNSHLRSYLVNNKLNIQCRIECISQVQKCVSDKSEYQIDEPPANGSYMSLILNSGRFSDLSLKVGSKMISAHKFILASESAALCALLRCNERNILDMCDYTVAIFEDLLNFIYTGNIKKNYFNHICELYSEANKFGVLNLKDVCSVLLSSNLTIENVPFLLKLSSFYNDQYLIKACIMFMKVNCIDNLTSSFMKK